MMKAIMKIADRLLCFLVPCRRGKASIRRCDVKVCLVFEGRSERVVRQRSRTSIAIHFSWSEPRIGGQVCTLEEDDVRLRGGLYLSQHQMYYLLWDIFRCTTATGMPSLLICHIQIQRKSLKNSVRVLVLHDEVVHDRVPCITVPVFLLAMVSLQLTGRPKSLQDTICIICHGIFSSSQVNIQVKTYIHQYNNWTTTDVHMRRTSPSNLGSRMLCL